MQFDEASTAAKNKDHEMQEYIRFQEKKMQMRATMRENNTQTQILRNLEKLKGRMDLYQGQSAVEALTLNDFHKMEQVTKIGAPILR